MEKIKNFFKKAWNFVWETAKFAYNLTIASIVELPAMLMDETTSGAVKAFQVLDALARGTIIASFFVAIPTALVVLAWTYVVVFMVVATVILLLAMIPQLALIAAIQKANEDAAAPVDAAAPAAA